MGKGREMVDSYYCICALIVSGEEGSCVGDLVGEGVDARQAGVDEPGTVCWGCGGELIYLGIELCGC